MNRLTSVIIVRSPVFFVNTQKRQISEEERKRGAIYDENYFAVTEDYYLLRLHIRRAFAFTNYRVPLAQYTRVFNSPSRFPLHGRAVCRFFLPSVFTSEISNGPLPESSGAIFGKSTDQLRATVPEFRYLLDGNHGGGDTCIFVVSAPVIKKETSPRYIYIYAVKELRRPSTRPPPPPITGPPSKYYRSFFFFVRN